MGEMLVEVMRPRSGMPLDAPGEFLGPFPSGAPAIFIDTVARLGHSAGIIGGVGRDAFGRCLLERLTADGVDVEHVEQFQRGATAVAFVTYNEDGSRTFIFHIDGTPAVRIAFPDPPPSEAARFFHVMGCSLMANEDLRQQIVRAVEYFHARGTRISFDPNIRSELLGGRGVMEVAGPILSRCTVLMPAEAELKLLSGEEEPERAAEKLFGNPALETLVLKRGREGATIFTRQGSVGTPAYPVEEVDPTGAGDCFDAAFLCGMLEGKPLSDCGRMAAAAGALNAAAFGPMEGRISPDSVRELIG
jgi:sugar/nucleoside kinase (ribokinase family)